MGVSPEEGVWVRWWWKRGVRLCKSAGNGNGFVPGNPAEEGREGTQTNLQAAACCKV